MYSPFYPQIYYLYTQPFLQPPVYYYPNQMPISETLYPTPSPQQTLPEKETKEESRQDTDPTSKHYPLKANLLNDSTNVNKNFAKAIAQYALRHKSIIFQMLGEEKGNDFIELMTFLKMKLGNPNHIIRHTQDEDILKAFRILGNKFLKHDSVAYIYNSKIQHKTNHIKNKSIVKKNLLKY